MEIGVRRGEKRREVGRGPREKEKRHLVLNF